MTNALVISVIRSGNFDYNKHYNQEIISLPRPKKVRPEQEEKRLAAEDDLLKFIQLVHPLRSLGNVHRDIIRWWTRPEAKSHQILLIPRDHMKSALIAYRVVWEL